MVREQRRWSKAQAQLARAGLAAAGRRAHVGLGRVRDAGVVATAGWAALALAIVLPAHAVAAALPAAAAAPRPATAPDAEAPATTPAGETPGTARAGEAPAMTPAGEAPATAPAGETPAPAAAHAVPVAAAAADLAEPFSLHGQLTVVPQGHLSMHSPYAGGHSLSARRELQTSVTATAFLALRLWRGLEAVLNPEISAGTGLSGTHGIGAFPNGEIFRVDSPRPRFTIARAYLRSTWDLGAGHEVAPPAANILGGPRPRRRLELVAGKFSLNDFFDLNRFAHDPRSQFFNWALMDAGAYDYAADTRGYTLGLYAAYLSPNLGARLAMTVVPTTANGMIYDLEVAHAYGANAELTFPYAIAGQAGAVRLLAYTNRAHMGIYTEATAAGRPPDVTTTRRYGQRPGAAVNWEQALVGETGAFVRLSISDGRRETWAFTEIDRGATAGVQLDGAHWGRPPDRAGLAYIIGGLAAEHAAYLAAGGEGFMVGDGALHAGPEQVVEAYYSLAPLPFLSVSADLQLVHAPGYNRDRGPVAIAALRLHLEA